MWTLRTYKESHRIFNGSKNVEAFKVGYQKLPYVKFCFKTIHTCLWNCSGKI